MAANKTTQVNINQPTFTSNEADTVHSPKTPHSLKTPHKYPGKSQDSQDMERLSRQLYPTGRAWYMKKNGVFSRFHQALDAVLIRLSEDAYNVIDAYLPDNENFTATDATYWERKYGLIPVVGMSLPARKNRLLQKMRYPGNLLYRQSAAHIERTLRVLGFNIRVHENGIWAGGVAFIDVYGNISPNYKTVNQIITNILDTQHANTTQHADGIQHGGGAPAIIANKIDPNESYSVGGILWPTFFISGPGGISSPATIPENRIREFREAVLKLKPAHTVAYLIQ